jgi:pimeloyl-ACP methyl ester carboxylesterase
MRITCTLIALAMLLPAAHAAGPALSIDEFAVPGREAGITLHVRHKAPAGVKRFSPDRIVLFVHGATFPSSSTFDVDLPGGSWMDQLAARGYDVYALDIRGYGGSTRPAAMSQPPESNPPFARTPEAVSDIDAAVDFVSEWRGAHQLVLIGWSWGTTTTAAYAAQHPDKVARLVLVSPVWLGLQPQKYSGAYRTSTAESARAFAVAGMPKERIEEISPRANFDAWWQATLATDPEGAKRSPPGVRAPNGVMQDFNELWAAGKPAYDPAAIRAPTLLIVGEWDVITPPSMAQGLFSRLTQAHDRRLVLFSEGTHFMPIESQRARLMREVRNFLEDDQ